MSIVVLAYLDHGVLVAALSFLVIPDHRDGVAVAVADDVATARCRLALSVADDDDCEVCGGDAGRVGRRAVEGARVLGTDLRDHELGDQLKGKDKGLRLGH